MRKTLVAFLLASATPALAQQQTTTQDITAISNLSLYGAGAIQSGSSSDDQTLRTNPDVSIPPVMTTNRSCIVGDFSGGVGNIWIGGVGYSQTELDLLCEQRATSEALQARSGHRAQLAVTAAKLGLGPAVIARNFAQAEDLATLSERALTMNPKEWDKTLPAAHQSVPWEELWHP